MPISRLTLFLLTFGLLAAMPSQAQIFAVSGKPAGNPNQLTSVQANDNPADVAVNLANGFPVWYQDANNGRKYQLCLDTALTVAPGVVVNPCYYEPPLAVPPSFPANFGAEAIYWSATAFGDYFSSNGALNTALLVLSLEATGANEAALADGNQAVVSTIRLRIGVPVAGTYRITGPYGTRNYGVSAQDLLVERQINQTQALGVTTPQNFLVAMANGAAPAVEPVPPSLDVGVVNSDGLNIGPFLVPAATSFNPVTFAGGPIAVNGGTVNEVSYIGLPLAPNPADPLSPLTVGQPVVGSPLLPPAGNFLRIELLDPPADFFLNRADSSQTVQFNNFQLIGKLFKDEPNLAPVATDDVAATAINRSASIDVIANDLDLASGANSHGINVQAIAVASNDTLLSGPIVNALGMPAITAAHPTTAGGTVRRIINATTGKASFLYSPPVDYTGIDTFRYVVQDSGGLISEPATVTITVEDMQLSKAEYRPRTGKWAISGTSTDRTDNRITLTAGPRASLTPGGEVTATPVTSAARGRVALRVNNSRIEFDLQVDPLPATAVTAAHIHVGSPSENGPVIFSLHQTGIDAPFDGRRSGTLESFHLQARPERGISSFAAAVSAILSGNAYVNVHTGAFPAGEIRGQLSRPVIGTAEVSDDGPSAGQWEFRGHSKASPGGLPEVVVESANGIRVIGTPLRVR